MAIALNPVIPDTPGGFYPHPAIPNVCANREGVVMTYDPRIKKPEWYVLRGILNTHGRRQSQIAKKMRLHYQIVYECVAGVVPEYGHCKSANGLTIDHIDGDRDNNAFANLRLVTKRENVRSAHLRSNLPFAIRKRENGTYRVVLRVAGRIDPSRHIPGHGGRVVGP